MPTARRPPIGRTVSADERAPVTDHLPAAPGAASGRMRAHFWDSAVGVGSVPPAMDERDRQFRRETWAELDRGWTASIELLTATAVWMGLGWLLDRWLSTGPWLMAVGALIGFGLGTYLAFLRAEQQGRAEEAKRPRL